MMGQTPFAGVAWQVLHYLEGFRRLGYEVYYVEDTGDWPYDPDQNIITDDCRYTLKYLARVMDWCGMPNRWAYRFRPTGEVFGPAAPRFSNLFERADVLVNVTGTTWLRDEHLSVPVRIYVETDPVLPQIKVALGDQHTIDLLSTHTHHFTFAENLGAPDCEIPLERFYYHATRQPIVLDWWASAGLSSSNGSRKPSADCPFTTIASWRQSGKDIEWNGEIYAWSKHFEFLRFIDLPRRTESKLELALACEDAEAIRLLRSHGWRTVDALALSKDILPYRSYICNSRGEFTVMKPQYFRPRGGSFSDRGACYLAAARPVIIQDTGFSKILPTGLGLFAFRNMEDILVAMEAIESNYEEHRDAALQIATEYFAAEKVLNSMLEQVGL